MARRPTSHRVRADRHLPARDACPPGSGRAPARATGAPPRTRSDARPATGRTRAGGPPMTIIDWEPAQLPLHEPDVAAVEGQDVRLPDVHGRRHPGFVPRTGDSPSRCARRLAPLPAGRCARWNNPGASGARGRSCAIARLKRSDHRIPPIPVRFPAPRPDHSSSLAVAPTDGGIAPDPGCTQSLRRTSRQPSCGSVGFSTMCLRLTGGCADKRVDQSSGGGSDRQVASPPCQMPEPSWASSILYRSAIEDHPIPGARLHCLADRGNLVQKRPCA